MTWSNHVRTWGWALAALLLFTVPATGQSFGLTARYGMGVTQDVSDPTATVGLEGGLFVRPDLALAVRGDVYLFGFMCTGFASCPNQVKAMSLGVLLVPAPSGTASLYLGGDLGRTWWPGPVHGWVARSRAGVDARIVGPLFAGVELGYSRFMHSASAGEREPPRDIVGLSGGLGVRF
jgi:hypothetical protein